jgi:hypothetical protein
MKILHLTLTKKWFDMIKSGLKMEEYREIKPYWDKRLSKAYDAIRFANGYGKHVPHFTIELKGVRIGNGNPEWGAPPYAVYILSLGNILN